MIDIDNIGFKDFFRSLVIFIMIITISYYFIIMIRNLIRRYSFANLGDFFDKKYFSKSDFGLEGTDHLDFIINIRTDDASDDCIMRGRYRSNEINKISIEGDGPKCKNLRSNNKL